MNYITEIETIETLIGSKLSDASLIEPTDIRSVFGALTYFLKKISPLASGTFSLGDVQTEDVRTINLPYDVGSSDYRVEGSLVSKSANYKSDIRVFELIKDKTNTSFKICLREISNGSNDIDFDWAIYPKN